MNNAMNKTVDNDYVGRLVKPFESGNLGSLAFGNCGDDYGLSCGSYQLTLRWGNCIYFLKANFPKESGALYWGNRPDKASHSWPGPLYCSSPTEVKKVWTSCVQKAGGKAFFDMEHAYIKRAYYDPIISKLKNIFDPDTHSRMAQECMWSWAVHRGSAGAYNEFMIATQGLNVQITPADKLIDILYDERYKRVTVNRYKKGISSDLSERETLRPYCNVKPYGITTGATTGVTVGPSVSTTTTGSVITPVISKPTISAINANAVDATTAQNRTIEHTVVLGDTLWSLAVKHLGSGHRWQEIQKLNGLSSSLIIVGQILKIPNERG